MNRTDAVQKVDYGIITIKEEEFLAVKSRFEDFRHMRGTRYFRAEVRTSTGKRRTVALVRCLHQGQGDAQSVASDLIADLDPAWLLLVGIAGAVPAEEFGLGDVLLASRLHDFSVQAAIEGQLPELDVGGGRVHPSVEVLLSIIPGVAEELGPWNAPDHLGRVRPALDIPDDIADEQYYGKTPWRTRVRGALRSRFREERDAHRPRLRIGAVASSNSLVKDTQLVKGWKSAARSITHIEMELGGVYHAAWRPDRITPVLSVRGISDVVGFKRGAEWTDYACETAAAFAHALILSDLAFPDGAGVGADGDGAGADGIGEPLPKIVDWSEYPPEDLEKRFKAVEITWNIDAKDLTPDLEQELLTTVGRLAKLSEVIVLRRRYGSFIVTIAVTSEQVQRLTSVLASGALRDVGITGVRVVPVEEVYVKPAPAASITAQLGGILVREKEAHDLSRNPEFANFQFIGYRTSAAAVELVALCDADGLLEGDIVRLRDEFFDLVRRLPHDFGLKPRGRNPNGLLGFVFADGCPEHMARFIARQTRISHAAGTGGVSVAWALDVPAKRIHTHDNPVSIFPPVIVAARTVYPGLEYLQSLLETIEASKPPEPSRREPVLTGVDPTTKAPETMTPKPPVPKTPQQDARDLIHILFLAADPTNSGLDVQEELAQIETNLRMSRERERLQLKAVLAGSFGRLSQAMLDESPTIVHFAGHGRKDGLVLRGPTGDPHVVPIEALADLLKPFSDTVQCVVLNACWSEPQARAIQQHIPYVIGTRERIQDATAVAFSTGFYQAIGAGRAVPFAFKIGVAHAKSMGTDDAHLITLYTPDDQAE
jgi:nucleoside phosphorylase